MYKNLQVRYRKGEKRKIQHQFLKGTIFGLLNEVMGEREKLQKIFHPSPYET